MANRRGIGRILQKIGSMLSGGSGGSTKSRRSGGRSGRSGGGLSSILRRFFR
jgi:hypothetical protein